MKTREKHIEEILTGFQHVKRQLVCQVKQSWLTHAQWMALAVIREKESAGIKKIAEILWVSSSAATQLVDDLEKNSFVTRRTNPDDKREVLISLTKKAQNQFHEIHKERIRTFSLLFDALDEDEFTQYVALNKKIISRIQSL